MLPVPPTRHLAPRRQQHDGAQGRETAFALRCNALVVEGAERYYRNM